MFSLNRGIFWPCEEICSFKLCCLLPRYEPEHKTLHDNRKTHVCTAARIM